MATIASEFEGRDVSIGRVFNRAFGTIGSNPGATLGIAFLFGALPGTLVGYGSQRIQAANMGSMDVSATIGISLATFALSIFFWTITQGALVRATVAYSEGRKASLAESALASLRLAFPLFLLAIVTGVAIGFAMILLIVPGIFVYVIWSVAAPALVEERRDVLEALSRSTDLTHGARWKILALELLVVVGSWIFSTVTNFILFAASGGMLALTAVLRSGEFPLAFFLVGAATNTVTYAVWGVIQTSLYVELRNWKEGPPADALAQVFG